MGKSIREIEALGASELQEWMLYWRHEPWGPYRDNIHAGLIAATLANIYRKKGAEATTFEDFMLVDPEEHKRRQSQKTFKWMKSVAKKNGNRQ